MWVLAVAAMCAAYFVVTDPSYAVRVFCLLVFGSATISLGFLISETEVMDDPEGGR